MADLTQLEYKRLLEQQLRDEAHLDPDGDMALFFDVMDYWDKTSNRAANKEEYALDMAVVAYFDDELFPLNQMLLEVVKAGVRAPDELVKRIYDYLPITDENRNEVDCNGLVAFHDFQRELRGLPAA